MSSPLVRVPLLIHTASAGRARTPGSSTRAADGPHESPHEIESEIGPRHGGRHVSPSTSAPAAPAARAVARAVHAQHASEGGRREGGGGGLAKGGVPQRVSVPAYGRVSSAGEMVSSAVAGESTGRGPRLGPRLGNGRGGWRGEGRRGGRRWRSCTVRWSCTHSHPCSHFCSYRGGARRTRRGCPT